MPTPLSILLVEDNPDHAELIIRNLENHSIANRIRHLTDGEAALDYLLQRGAYGESTASPRPHVVLLDLRLPKVDGLQVLRRIRATRELNEVPVVVLTTSHAESDLHEAYENHANSYLVKPLNFEKFTEMIETLGLYWLGMNRPAASRAADRPV